MFLIKQVIVNFSDSDYVDNIDKIDGTTAKITALRRKWEMGFRHYHNEVNEAVGSYNG